MFCKLKLTEMEFLSSLVQQTEIVILPHTQEDWARVIRIMSRRFLRWSLVNISLSQTSPSIQVFLISFEKRTYIL